MRFYERHEFKPALEILLKVRGYLSATMSGFWMTWRSATGGLAIRETSIHLIKQIVEACADGPLRLGQVGGDVSVGRRSMQGAEQAFSQHLKLVPKSISTLAALNMISVFDRNSHRARTLAQTGREQWDLSSTDRATAYNALGRIEEAAGNYTASPSGNSQKAKKFR